MKIHVSAKSGTLKDVLVIEVLPLVEVESLLKDVSTVVEPSAIVVPVLAQLNSYDVTQLTASPAAVAED